jgi:hypothetical protein
MLQGFATRAWVDPRGFGCNQALTAFDIACCAVQPSPGDRGRVSVTKDPWHSAIDNQTQTSSHKVRSTSNVQIFHPMPVDWLDACSAPACEAFSRQRAQVGPCFCGCLRVNGSVAGCWNGRTAAHPLSINVRHNLVEMPIPSLSGMAWAKRQSYFTPYAGI